MTTTQYLAIDLAASVLALGAWLGATAVVAGNTARRRTALLTLALMAVAVVALAVQALVAVPLFAAGWWFVQEKVLFAIPFALLATLFASALALPPLLRSARGDSRPFHPIVPTILVGATLASATGLLARFLVGYPFGVTAAVAFIVIVVVATVFAYVFFARATKRLILGLAALTALCVLFAGGLAWLGNVASPVALASHGHDEAAPEAEAQTVSVDELRTADVADAPVRSFDLTATEERVTLASGTTVNAWTFGSLPGPELRVDEGDVVEVTLHNDDVAAGVTLHWHGVDVPNGEDGVAGVTQNAVLPGESFTYRFVAEQVGTYWYHTHQSSADGVKKGLFGSLVVIPAEGIDQDIDVLVPVHTIGGSVLLGNSDESTEVVVAAGDSVRIRLINTDQLPQRFRLTGAEFEVVAVDGQDIGGPTPVRDVALRVPAGGRIDVALTMPDAGVRLSIDSSSTAFIALAPSGVADSVMPDRTDPDLDLLGYGAPTAAELPQGDGLVEATMVLDQLPRLLNGRPINGYTVNGEVFPRIDSIEVHEGNVVRLTVANRGWETHPMHVHGHHALVLSRNGIDSTGSPLWVDTFDVQPGEVWVVAFLADNPGIWMDHCHNLDHAAEGMMMALHYSGVISPYEQGGEHGNMSE